MGFLLKGRKKNECKKVNKFKNFFLSRLNLTREDKNSYNTSGIKALRHDVSFARYDGPISNCPSYILTSASHPIAIPVSSSTRPTKKRLKKMILAEIENGVFSAFGASKINFSHLLTYSLSLLTKTYPQNWKTIFVHFLEKSNLLVRSDNNTGFSVPNILQTTTI